MKRYLDRKKKQTSAARGVAIDENASNSNKEPNEIEHVSSTTDNTDNNHRCDEDTDTRDGAFPQDMDIQDSGDEGVNIQLQDSESLPDRFVQQHEFETDSDSQSINVQHPDRESLPDRFVLQHELEANSDDQDIDNHYLNFAQLGRSNLQNENMRTQRNIFGQDGNIVRANDVQEQQGSVPTYQSGYNMQSDGEVVGTNNPLRLVLLLDVTLLLGMIHILSHCYCLFIFMYIKLRIMF